MRAKLDSREVSSVFRRALPGDIPQILEIIKRAVEKMLSEGKCQWNENYPNEVHIKTDIEKEEGFVIEINNKIEAYGAVSFDGEPFYDIIEEGEWLSNSSYAVIHRMAADTNSQFSGLGKLFIDYVKDHALQNDIHSIRLDTNYDNEIMLHLLEKSGFTFCGKVNYPKGSRLAFEKLF